MLASILGRLGALDLNVLEAHAFCAQSGVALDVFVVSGWHGSAGELEVALVETDPDTLTPRSAQRAEDTSRHAIRCTGHVLTVQTDDTVSRYISGLVRH